MCMVLSVHMYIKWPSVLALTRPRLLLGPRALEDINPALSRHEESNQEGALAAGHQ